MRLMAAAFSLIRRYSTRLSTAPSVIHLGPGQFVHFSQAGGAVSHAASWGDSAANRSNSAGPEGKCCGGFHGSISGRRLYWVVKKGLTCPPDSEISGTKHRRLQAGPSSPPSCIMQYRGRTPCHATPPSSLPSTQRCGHYGRQTSYRR